MYGNGAVTGLPPILLRHKPIPRAHYPALTADFGAAAGVLLFQTVAFPFATTLTLPIVSILWAYGWFFLKVYSI